MLKFSFTYCLESRSHFLAKVEVLKLMRGVKHTTIKPNRRYA